jgi:hypothetical protein
LEEFLGNCKESKKGGGNEKEEVIEAVVLEWNAGTIN